MNQYDKVSIRPQVTMLSVLKYLEYETWYALSEFIDNAIDSYVKNVSRIKEIEGNAYQLEVKVEINEQTGRISIRDNAAGISAEDYPRAFRAAEIPPDNSGLSEFGMGMKSAACWFSDNWSVTTTALGENLEKKIFFDMKKIFDDKLEELDVESRTTVENHHYTVIDLYDVHRMPRRKGIAKVKDHLRSIYREFIRKGTLRLYVNGDMLTFDDPKILYVARYDDLDSDPILWRKDICFNIEEGMSVHGFVAIREKASTSEAGFALFRRGRVIEGSFDNGFRPDFIFGAPNSYRYQRVFGELHLEGFNVNFTKKGIQWDENLDIFLKLLKDDISTKQFPLLQHAEQYRVRATEKEYKSAVKALDLTVSDLARKAPKAITDIVNNFVQRPVEEGEELSKTQQRLHRQFDVRFNKTDWNISIELSYDPSILTPGPDYTGGSEFFKKNPMLVEQIPSTEISTSGMPLYEIPESLKKALRIFYLGVVAGEPESDPRNRTMLVHPSRLQGDHSEYTSWIRNTVNSWQRILSTASDEEKVELLTEFRESYNELQNTVANLQSFDELTGINLIHALKYTQIVEVNSKAGETPEIPWKDFYSWVLIGGQAMDRGFTVEGLTVTYMPRPIGSVPNVDTIQQRARFFGYKRSYLGFCRVFLDQPTIDTYNAIVDHEEDVRTRLSQFDLNNKHLNDWDREVVLDSMLNLTRRSVIYDEMDRGKFGNDWVRINAPHDTEALIPSNRDALFSFVKSKVDLFVEDQGHLKRTQEQKHLVATIALKDCLENLLNKLRFTKDSDSATYSSLRSIIKGVIDKNPDEECIVYLMSTGSIDTWQPRIRRLNRNEEIQQLFQGRNPRSGEVIYPGDSEIKDNELVTIQVHLLNVRDTEFENVPTLAVWVPENMATDIIRLL